VAFELPPLPYDYTALEPHVDTQTMQIHHDKHEATYVTNLNNALAKYPELGEKTLEQLITNIAGLPADIQGAVRNNGGGFYNHELFWSIMGPNGGGVPTGALADAINEAFGSLDDLKAKVNAAGAGQFGSGWAWISVAPGGALQVEATPNQNNPLMDGRIPILGVDVWEHAYYLKWQNRRADYLANWWGTVNWSAVAERLAAAAS
jgi:Fe-Mn family superoxide dismutase